MKRLQIGIDANEANVKNKVGTGQYTSQILRKWHEQKEIDFNLYHRDPLQIDMPPRSESWRYHKVGPERGWIKFALPLHLALHSKNDVFWSPAHYMPLYTGCKSVVTIHDLAYEYFPKLFLPSDLYKLKHWTRAAVKQGSHVIAVSEATKYDLVKLYGVKKSKITVIHNGYDAGIFNTTVPSKRSILSSYNLTPFNYILFLGTIQPRKNAIKLIQAFHLLKAGGYTGKLVIAGAIGWLADETLNLIKKSPDSKDIVLTGYVSDDARKALYTSADVFVLPSLYEGFGVPAIEAMACGAPVAVADNSSLPEVIGSAGALFNASDPEGMAASILKLKNNRQAWVKRGLARVKQFSWERCANLTLEVLQKVARSKS